MRRPAAALAWSVATACWTALVWWLLTSPAPPAVATPWLPGLLAAWQDKIGHGALFLVQAGLLERVARASGRFAAAAGLWLALGLCLALGAATELRQRSVPTRQADVADFCADGAGALLYGAALLAARAFLPVSATPS